MLCHYVDPYSARNTTNFLPILALYSIPWNERFLLLLCLFLLIHCFLHPNTNSKHFLRVVFRQVLVNTYLPLVIRSVNIGLQLFFEFHCHIHWKWFSPIPLTRENSIA